jgi:hypothetical protein
MLYREEEVDEEVTRRGTWVGKLKYRFNCNAGLTGQFGNVTVGQRRVTPNLNME